MISIDDVSPSKFYPCSHRESNFLERKKKRIDVGRFF